MQDILTLKCDDERTNSVSLKAWSSGISFWFDACTVKSERITAGIEINWLQAKMLAKRLSGWQDGFTVQQAGAELKMQIDSIKKERWVTLFYTPSGADPLVDRVEIALFVKKREKLLAFLEKACVESGARVVATRPVFGL